MSTSIPQVHCRRVQGADVRARAQQTRHSTVRNSRDNVMARAFRYTSKVSDIVEYRRQNAAFVFSLRSALTETQ